MSYLVDGGECVETKVRLLDGTNHIINGHPKDYIQVIDGMGLSQNKTVVSKEGQLIKLCKVVTMQVNK